MPRSDLHFRISLVLGDHSGGREGGSEESSPEAVAGLQVRGHPRLSHGVNGTPGSGLQPSPGGAAGAQDPESETSGLRPHFPRFAAFSLFHGTSGCFFLEENPGFLVYTTKIQRCDPNCEE